MTSGDLSRLMVACLALTSGCSSKPEASGTSASAAVSAQSPASPADPKAKGVCEVETPDEHACTELWDDELVSEQEPTCTGKFSKGRACPRADLVGVCRLPDGSLRYGYPPKTPTTHEKRCKESQGKWSLGSAIPTADPDATVSCANKWDGMCEEEVVRLASRVGFAKDECATFGGTFSASGGCSREGATSLCDLRGKRTVVMTKPDSVEARQRFCESKGGKLVSTAPPPDPSASASAAVDEDPPSPKPDVVIRKE